MKLNLMYISMPNIQRHVKHKTEGLCAFFCGGMLSYRSVRQAKKRADQITLQEHMEAIASAGGKARAERLSPKRKSAIGRKAGKAGGRARAQALTKEQRREIARKAAAARWKKNRDRQ